MAKLKMSEIDKKQNSELKKTNIEKKLKSEKCVVMMINGFDEWAKDPENNKELCEILDKLFPNLKE